MEIKDECKELLTDSKIKFEEKKSVMYFINNENKTIQKIKIDGCVCDDKTEELRCDFLVIDGNNNYFVELKGSEILHAASQIINTKNKLKLNNKKVCYAFIIFSGRISPTVKTNMQKAKSLLNLSFNHNHYFIEKTGFEFNIETLNKNSHPPQL